LTFAHHAPNHRYRLRLFSYSELYPLNPTGTALLTTLASTALFSFDNSYARLPDRFYARLGPTVMPEPRLVKLNKALAEELGLDPDALASPEGVAVLAGNSVPGGSEPLAMAYAGHQFGQFVPQLGDGRAILLGEVIGRDGMRRDIQLKGAGQTPFSRRGDGRAVLGPVMREYIISEAMAALGIPTTRALAAVLTGETVWRERPLPGAVLARVASSHVRVGTFQYFAARGDYEAVRLLADYVIGRHYPEIATAEQKYDALLRAVIQRQAQLVAQWMSVGFIHGVMNTDNMSIAGETLDYGPCAFMDTYHPETVFSSIDMMGRYAYGNQPLIAQWNLARLAETLLPLMDDDADKAVERAQAAIGGFIQEFEAAYLAIFGRKIGLAAAGAGDADLIRELFSIMAANAVDFTLAFRRLCNAVPGTNHDEAFAALFREPRSCKEWLNKWRLRLATEADSPEARPAAMRAANPAYIPRNHRVEEAIAAAEGDANFGPFERLLQVLAVPFEERSEFAAYSEPPTPEQVVRQTFCGT
jgi:uncharacterized protein YdiU (UPF0061 family)